MSEQSVEQLHQLVLKLQDGDCFEHAVSGFETIETHISIVLLTGDYAYKFKKPVDLGFVDFTTLDKRRHYCEEELRLNRRLAPELYLDVITIGGTHDQPGLNVSPAIEYAVKMRQFPHGAELEQAISENRITADSFAELGRIIAAFHADAPSVTADSPLGTYAAVRQQVLDNFESIGNGPVALDLSDDLKRLREWSDNQLQDCQQLIDRRHDQGYVRECHGDMHVTNMICLDDRIQVFDCIEFNETFRWIDVMNEVAFLLMDLDMRDRPDLSRVFLNAYLESGGDYHGLPLLNLFRVYRSMVRAKIANLRLEQDSQHESLKQRITEHVRLARRYVQTDNPPVLVITHGFSGSGKTHVTDDLIPAAGAIRVRSDIERKRLQGLASSEHSDSDIGQGLYAAAQTELTYDRLAECAEAIIQSGHAAIVDATFLKAAQRQRFHNLAESLNVPLRILDCQAPDSILRERIRHRSQLQNDASEADTAVLDHQLATAEALSASDRDCTIQLDTEQPLPPQALAERLGLLAKKQNAR